LFAKYLKQKPLTAKYAKIFRKDHKDGDVKDLTLGTLRSYPP